MIDGGLETTTTAPMMTRVVETSVVKAESLVPGDSPSVSSTIDRSSASSSPTTITTTTTTGANNVKPQQQQQQPINAPRLGPKDFIPLRIIGEGSFSTVVLARMVKDTKTLRACKVCSKERIKKEGKVEAIFRERDIMQYLSHYGSPFIIKLVGTFTDDWNLYFIMTYARSGELLDYMKHSLEPTAATFYAAEILLALEHMHSLGVVHRDLKPENILLNERMHIQISDFGSAMVDRERATEMWGLRTPASSTNEPSKSQPQVSPSSSPLNRYRRRGSFVGTAEYLSPEMWKEKKASNASDIWALGVIVYQMTAGDFPFRDDDVSEVTTRQERQVREYRIIKKIERLEYGFPEAFDPTVRDFVEAILKPDPEERLGVKEFSSSSDGVYHEIRRHPYFSSITGRWESLHEEVPPLTPGPSHDSDDDDVEELLNQEIGFNQRTIARLTASVIEDTKKGKKIEPPDPKDPEYQARLSKQRVNNDYHRFVEDNLILYQGLLDKKKGLFARRRMFLLTTGPRLFYVDPDNKVLKGEVPLSGDIKCVIKSFSVFQVHTVS